MSIEALTSWKLDLLIDRLGINDVEPSSLRKGRRLGMRSSPEIAAEELRR